MVLDLLVDFDTGTVVVGTLLMAGAFVVVGTLLVAWVAETFVVGSANPALRNMLPTTPHYV